MRLWTFVCLLAAVTCLIIATFEGAGVHVGDQSVNLWYLAAALVVLSCMSLPLATLTHKRKSE